MAFIKNISQVFLVFLVVVSGSSMAQAVMFDLDKVKPLSEVEYLPESDFDAATDVIDSVPYEDEFLSFQMRLPKGWTETSSAVKSIKSIQEGLSENVLGVVKHYISPPKDQLRSFFTVEAVELTYIIDARNWFIQYVLKSGLSLEQVGIETDKQVEALYVEVNDGVTYVVRVKSIINGPRVVMARYYVPMALYEAERVQQAQVIKSFHLTNREEVNIEELKTYGFLGQSFFDYPVSWALSAPRVKSINRMRAMIYHGNPNNQLAGQINIYLSNKDMGTSRSDELKFYQDKFQVENYKLNALIEKPEMKYHSDMKFGTTEVYQMKSLVSNLIDYELWVSILESDDYYYVVTLLSPARNDDFYTWARNMAAYKMVVQGVRRNDDSVDYYQFVQ